MGGCVGVLCVCMCGWVCMDKYGGCGEVLMCMWVGGCYCVFGVCVGNIVMSFVMWGVLNEITLSCQVTFT